MDLRKGLVIKSQSGFFTVHTGNGEEVVCRLRGRLKQERSESDIVAVGDHVQFSIVEEDGTGMIESVAERTRTLGRLAPLSGGRGARRWDRDGYLLEREQVIVANPDQAVFVIACAEQEDNFLYMRERADASGWKWIEIPTGHDAMITAPRELADILLSLA